MSAHPFAPGAVTRHARRIGTPAQRRELMRWLVLGAIAAAVTTGTALCAGVLFTLFTR